MLLLLILPTMPASAATTRANDVKVMFYDKWQTLPDKTLLEMGDRYLTEERNDSALVCYSVVANRYYEHDNLTPQQADNCILAMNNLGYMYHFYLYDYQKAYGYLSLAEKLSLKYNNKTHLPYILRDIAGILRSSDKLYEASYTSDDMLGPYGNAFRAALDIDDRKAVVQIFINMIDTAKDEKDFENLNEAVAIFKSLIDNGETIYLYKYADMLYEGTKALYQDDYDKAFDCFSQMESQIESDEPSGVRYLLQSKSKLSMVYFMTNRDREALKELEELEFLAKKHDVIDVQLNLYEVLSRYYKDHNDPERSNHYRMLYLNTKDSIASQHNLIKVKEMKFLNELDGINEEMRQLAYKRKMERYVTAGIAGIALLLLVIVFILIYNYRQLKIKNRSIYQRSVEALEAEKTIRELYEKLQANPQPETDSPAGSDAKYHSSDLDDAQKKEIAGRIRFIMDNSDEIFQEGFSIDQLASLANTKKRHVSQVINEQMEHTFTSLLCDYRIKEACRRLNDNENYGKYTIGAIALSVGFKSQSNFVSNFKRVMGLTPSEYQRQAKE